MNGYQYLTPDMANIPPELRALPQWVTWKAIPQGHGEKPKKVPYCADLLDSKASSTDPSTWSTFDRAVTAYEEEGSDLTGIGFVLNGSEISGVDIDDCVDIDTGEIAPEAMALLARLQANYIEFSPSGKGLRAFGYAEPLLTGRNGKLDGLKVEFYSNGRYLTLTGHALKNGPLRTLVGFQEEAAKVDTRTKKDPVTGEAIETSADERIADLMMRIRSGDVYHDSLRDLAASLAATGMYAGAIVNALRALMRASDAVKDDRWAARMKQIPGLVSSACAKFAPPPILPREAFRLMTADEVAALPPLKWRIKQVLPASGLAVVYGPSTSGKSFLALDMLAAVADGREWYGYRCVSAPVVYLCLEGEGGLSQRVQAYRKCHGTGAGAAMRFVTAPFRLLENGDVAELSRIVLDAGGAGAVVCLDTLNRAMPGADENSSVDMGNAIASAYRLQAALGGLVLLVHHSGKDVSKGPRGHSSLYAALDGVVELTRNGESRTWINRKAKDGKDGAEHSFRLEIVELGHDVDGDVISSCVAVPEDIERHKARRLTPAQQTALQALTAACREAGQPYPDEAIGGVAAHLEGWREAFYRVCTSDNQPAKKVAFQRVRRDLIGCGAVMVMDDIYRPTDPGIQATIVLTSGKRNTEHDGTFAEHCSALHVGQTEQHGTGV